MSGEPEPRRSVRSTKGQHKALDQLEPPAPAVVDNIKKRGGKKGKKAVEKTEEPEDEIIRCVCGATEQDEDSGEPWIACDTCTAWQHNVCMGMSVYSEDLPEKYFCEQCQPEDHKELLEGMAKGEKPWEARRRAYEVEQADKKKKKGSKKGKKRQSDSQEEPQSSQKSKASPAPEKKAAPSKATAGTKRKDRDDSQDKDLKATPKMRKVSETKALPVLPPYNPPEDLPDKLTELPQQRQGPAQLLMKSLVVAVNTAEKKGAYSPADGVSNESRAERLSIAIERAVHDTHPSQKEYAAQVRTLTFNLKKNQELCERLLNHTLTPPMLAAMTTEELASEDLQRETAEMKARAEKQSILITEDGPRMRRTHKGDEMVADENFAIPSDETPSVARRPSAREPPGEAARPSESDQSRESAAPGADNTQYSASGDAMQIDPQHSPSADNFDIKKVFSSVKSPTVGHHRRPSAPAPVAGPGDDPDVDRLLEEDGNDSPPYSPSEETDPDVVWRGHLSMPSVANFYATAKYAGGANLARTIGLPWTTLIPHRLKVAGRISEENATEYLCGLRYSAPTDIVVASLTPATDDSKVEFDALVNYFVSKKRYAVVGDKGIANVRDTYVIPVLAGTGNHPEFMLNLEDNLIPHTRTENILLLVIVYRNDPGQMEKLHGPNWAVKASQSPGPNASTPTPAGFAQRAASISAPAFSPTSPHGPFTGFPASRQSHTPAHATPQPPHHTPYGGQPSAQQQQQQHQKHPAPPLSQEAKQQMGEALAHEILGPLIDSPTVSFLLPQAHQMTRNEWEVVRMLYEREPKSREDLTHLSQLLEKEGGNNTQSQAPQPPLRSHVPPPPQPPITLTPAPPAHHAPAPSSGSGSGVPHLISRTPIPIPVPPGMPASIAQAHQNRAPPPPAASHAPSTLPQP